MKLIKSPSKTYEFIFHFYYSPMSTKMPKWETKHALATYQVVNKIMYLRGVLHKSDAIAEIYSQIMYNTNNYTARLFVITYV